MKLIRLPIQGQQSVAGTFDYAACLVGDAVLYSVNQRGVPLGPIQTALVPDEGDDAPPAIEVQDDSLLGVTGTGRPVLAFRSGDRNPDGTWNERSALWLGVGAASALREPGHSIVVETTQPGPAGPAGAPGPRGAKGDKGDPGVPGQPGGDAEVDDATIDRIAARVWSIPPSPDHANISGLNFGTDAQEVIAYLATRRQDLFQEVVLRVAEALTNMAQDNRLPALPGEDAAG